MTHNPGPRWQAPGYAPPPPRRRRTGLILGIVAAVFVLLLGGAFLIWRVIETSIPAGVPASGEPPPSACALDKALLEKIGTTNPGGGYDERLSSGRNVQCTYLTLKGSADNRDRNFAATAEVFDQADARTRADAAWAEHLRYRPANAKPLAGVGEQAESWLTDGDTTTATVLARQGDTVVYVAYTGFDKTFLGRNGIDPAEAVQAATDVARALLARLS